jgi:iron complex outermembrane recepter protein
MKNFSKTLRLSALACACATACAAQAQSQAVPQMREVVITSRLLGDTDSQPLGMSVVTQSDIQRAGATTVNEALIRILGVPGRQDFYGGGDYALDIRGFGGSAGSNQAIIVDGIKINEADLGGTRLAGIPIESVERIEVLRGSGAVLYGEGATGGVIIITTKAGSGSARKTSGSVYAAAGSYGLRELRGTVTYGNGGLSLDATAQKRKTDNHRDNFDSTSESFGLSAQWSGDWLRLGARVARDVLDARLPGSLTAAQYIANPAQTNTPNDVSAIDNASHGLFAEANLADWRLTAEMGWREKELRSNTSGFAYEYDVSAKTYALRATNSSAWTGFKNKVIFGLDHGKWQRDTLGAFGSTAKQSSRALYVRDELTLESTGTDVSAGYRSEKINKSELSSLTSLNDTQHAWELGVRQSIAKDLSLYGRIGTSFRLANVDEFSFTVPGTNLLPQTSRDAELGVRYSTQDYKLDVRYYQNKLKNEIGYDPNANGPFGPGSGANVNFDPTQRSGFEVNASMAATKALNLSLNAAVRKAKFSSGVYAGNEVALVAQRTLALRADWSPAAKHRLSGGVNYVGTQKVDFANQCSAPAYTTADARYAYDWNNVEIALGITNLFDKKHYSQAFSCNAGVTDGIYPEAGRAATLSLRAKF